MTEIFHVLSLTTGPEPVQLVEAHADQPPLCSGPVMVTSLDEIDRAMAITANIVQTRLEQLSCARTAKPPAPATPAPVVITTKPIELQQAPAPVTPQLAPIPAPVPPPTPDADPASTPAPADEINAVKAIIESLTPEWQDYLITLFRAEFGIAANRKISTAIKSVAHVAFLRSKLPPSPSAA